MKKLVLTAALGAVCLSLGACGREEGNEAANAAAANDAAAAEAEGGALAGDAAAGGAAGTATGGFPKGARIVEEEGATWRVDADGTRVRLGDADSRIVVENGVRYRVDPGGSRVRIDDQGIAIDLPDVDTPDVDIGINKKGNPDIDVKDKSDGDSGPN